MQRLTGVGGILTVLALLCGHLKFGADVSQFLSQRCITLIQSRKGLGQHIIRRAVLPGLHLLFDTFQILLIKCNVHISTLARKPYKSKENATER